MRLRLLIPALLLLALAPGTAAAAERPIVFAMVIDGLDGDAVTPASMPFISSLLAGQGGGGTLFEESRSVMLTETNPNHSSMMTGAYAESSGIPGNGFAIYAPLGENSCTPTGPADLAKLPTATSGEDASCLEAQSVFEAVKRQGNPDGLVTAAVMGKPKLGAIFAGRHVNAPRLDVDYLWAPCSGSLDRDDDYCQDADTNPATGYAVSDAEVMDAVVATLDGVDTPGGRRRPDFTFVNLPQVDSAGHAFGTGSPYQVAIGMADDQIERLANELRSRGLWERSVLMLLSDHSMDTTPTKTSTASTLTGAGIPEDAFVVLGNGSASMVYLADRTSPQRFALLKRMREVLDSSPVTSEVLYREPNPEDGGARHTLDAVHPGWRLAGPRTGDLVAVHTPGGAWRDAGETSNPLTDVGGLLIGQHGGPQTRDNFFAVVGGSPAVRTRRLDAPAAPLFDDTLQNRGQAENVDVAPTVMGLLGLFAPADSEGRFLGEAVDLARLPGGGAPAIRARLRVKARRPARRRRCTRRNRRHAFLRVSVGPPGASYDLRVRRAGRRRGRALLTASSRSAVRLKVRRGRRARLFARVRSASGVPGPWTRRPLRPRRICRP